MVLSTKLLLSAHAIEHLNMKIAVNNENIERVPSTNLLGTYINEHLKWENNVKYICTSCYSILVYIQREELRYWLVPGNVKNNRIN